MMNDFLTHINVNVFHLGSHDLLIGMEWLEDHKVLLNYFEKYLHVLTIMEII